MRSWGATKTRKNSSTLSISTTIAGFDDRAMLWTLDFNRLWSDTPTISSASETPISTVPPLALPNTHNSRPNSLDNERLNSTVTPSPLAMGPEMSSRVILKFHRSSDAVGENRGLGQRSLTAQLTS